MANVIVVGASRAAGGPAFYGNGISCDGVGNAHLWQTATKVSFRFRATQSSAINSVRIYVLAEAGYPGYCDGDFGTLRMRLVADDGTASHLPVEGTVYASLTATPPGSGAGVLYTFPSPYVVTAGTLYHILIENTAADPYTNHFSTDSVYVESGGGYAADQVNPSLNLVDWGQCRNLGTWAQQNNYTPIAKITYANGEVQGQGIVDSRIGYEVNVGGIVRARERFTPSRDVLVSRAVVRLRRVSGTGALSLRLETAAGVEIATATVAAASIGTSVGVWATGTFAGQHLLSSGTEYHLMATAPAGTSYAIWPSREGSNYGYTGVCYVEGVAEQDPGTGTWAYWNGIYDDASLQFALGR